MDAASPHVHNNETCEQPNAATQKFYNMLNATNQELWFECENHYQLLAVSHLLNLKVEHHFSENCFDEICHDRGLLLHKKTSARVRASR